MNKKANVVLNFLLFLIFLALVFEGIILLLGFIYADEIECNLLWCKFKTTNKDIEINQKCYENDKEINCSEIDNSLIKDKIKDIIEDLNKKFEEED